jgi:nitroreductase
MGFINHLDWRYATKKFDGRELLFEKMDKILEAIRMAPSAFGIQPYRVIVVTEPELKKTLQPHVNNQQQVTTCSHLLVFCADLNTDRHVESYLAQAVSVGRKDITDDPDYDYRLKAKAFAKKMDQEWAAKQAYIALGFALSACAELEIDSCPMEAFDPKGVATTLNLPKDLLPKVLLAVGYRDATEVKKTKIRLPASELFDQR